MKRQGLLIVSFFLIVTAGAVSNLFTASKTPVPANYQRMWRQVDSLDSMNLPESAMKIVAGIKAAAQAEKNTIQQTKAHIYSAYFLKKLNDKDNDMLAALEELNKAVKTLPFPENTLIYSTLAEYYTSYYENHRYTINERTVNNDVQENMLTWDTDDFRDTIEALHMHALANTTALQKIPVRRYSDLLEKAQRSDSIRPTLFDLLAHRAIDNFATFNTGNFKMYFANDSWFLPAAGFASGIAGPDLGNMQKTVALYMALTRFHLDDSNKLPLLYLDLERYRLAASGYSGSNKDKLVTQSLEKAIDTYGHLPDAALFGADLCKYINNEHQEYQQQRQNHVKAIAVARNMQQRFPGSAGATQCAAIAYEILRSSLEARIPSSTTYPGKGAVLALNSKQLSNVTVRIVQVPADSLANWRIQLESVELQQKLQKLPAVHHLDVQLASTPNYYARNTYVLLPAMAHGQYVVCFLGKNTDSIFGYAPLQITSLELTRVTDPSGYTFQVKDKLSGKPVKNVTLTFYQQTYNYETRSYIQTQVGEGKTNADGFTVTDLPRDMQRMQLVYKLTYQDKTDATGNIYNYRTDQKKEEEWEESFQVFSDRNIYRPGQTLYFKGIASETHSLTKENRPLKNEEVEIRLNGPDGRPVKSLDLVTNDFGSVQGSIALPLSGQTGTYVLYCEDRATYIQVEEYKRPRFEVVFDTLKTAYRINDSITLKGYAKALSGENLSGAKVDVSVYRSAYYPFYRWDIRYPEDGGASIPVTFSAITDNDGAFTLTFKAIPGDENLKETKPVYQFMTDATVTDISGETHTAKNTVTIGVNDFTLDIEAPQVVIDQERVTIKASSRNLNGVEIPLKGTLRIEEVNIAPGYTLEQAMGVVFRPTDSLAFTTEDALRALPGILLARRDTTVKSIISTEVQGTGSRLVIPDTRTLASGQYRITLESRDKQGDLVSVQKFFTLINSSSKKPLENTLFMAVPITGKLQPTKKGWKLSAYISASLPGLYINYRVADKQKTYVQQAFTLNSQARLLEIDLPATAGPTVSIVIYATYQGEYFTKTISYSKTDARKPLDIHWETFRNKLIPGQKETWRMTIANSDSSLNAAEVLAGMYDASLDQLYQGSSWDVPLMNITYEGTPLQAELISAGSSTYFVYINYTNGQTFSWREQEFDQLQTMTYRGDWGYGDADFSGNVTDKSIVFYAAPVMRADINAKTATREILTKMPTRNLNSIAQTAGGVHNAEDISDMESPSSTAPAVTPRRNLQETAFFYPQLRTNSKGEIVLEFTVPESLTRWRFRAFAHNLRMEQGYLESEVTTSKELMVQSNMPRFLREGDEMVLSARISNTGPAHQSGQAVLVLTDAYTQKLIEEQAIDFNVEPGQNVAPSWSIKVPSGVQMLNWKIVAAADKLSDGEENVVPVLSNRVMVTEALPMAVRGSKSFNFASLLNSSTSKTIKHERLTVEFSSNPAWYAVLALPYMIEYPQECAEQLFHRFYANHIALGLASNDPRIRHVYDAWKTLGKGDQLRSNLEKNAELKQLLLEETPWVLEGNNETERMQRLGELFDQNMLENSLKAAENKLRQMQLGSGAFPWFNGMQEDRYITSLIVAGYGRLYTMNARLSQGYTTPSWISANAVNYLYSRLKEDYRILKRDKADLKLYTPTFQQLQDLYALSFYLQNSNSTGTKDESYTYFIARAAAMNNSDNRYVQALRALVLHRNGQSNVAKGILQSMKENALKSEEMGMYWKNVTRGWYWYQAPVETQALCIEAFDEITNDQQAVEAMKLWLLKQKQTHNWGSTVATADACYALLKRGSDLLQDSRPVAIYLDGKAVDFGQPAMPGTGYVKQTYSGMAIQPAMGKIRVEKSDSGLAWGAVYWQYTEQMDKVKNSTAGLRVQKKLFRQERDANGKDKLAALDASTRLSKGDKVTVRLIISTDRDMEYVALKDLRAAGLEPAEVLSGYKYSAGLGYYQSIRDASTSFFFNHISKGTYVLEYTLVVNNEGLMQSGTASIECMYAPEFRATAGGPLLTIH